MPRLYSLYCSFNMNTNISYTHGLETLVFCELVRDRKPLGRNVQTPSSEGYGFQNSCLQGTYWSPASISWQKLLFSTIALSLILPGYSWLTNVSNHWVRCKPGLWMCHEIYNLNTFLNASVSPLAVQILAPCNLKFPAHFHISPWVNQASVPLSFEDHTGRLPSNM